MLVLGLFFATLPSLLAFKAPLKRVARSATVKSGILATTGDGSGNVTFSNVMDLIYMADISIGGVDYTVQLDSGSSDLWVRPDSDSVPGASVTDLTYNISYGSGHAYGHVATAPVSFAGYTVNSQAFLNVEDSNNPIFGYGAVGILGLGFTSLSGVNNVVTKNGGSWGQSFLYNAFAQDNNVGNYMAFLLERTTDLSTTVGGSFTIGELDKQYADNITSTAKIPTWPVSNPTRWTVLLEGYEFADGIKRTLQTKVSGAPSSVILLDSGASYTYAPEELVTGLYGGISGARFDSTRGLWIVPCDQEVNLAFWIAGRKLDWHPLDVVVPDLGDNTTCVGSVVPDEPGSSYDVHGGDVFLRNLYNLFDFGDYDELGAMGDPYVQLWSLTDITAASAEFHQIRGGTAPDYKQSQTGTSNASNESGTSTTASSSTTVQVLNDNVEKLLNYVPIALGILGLNTLILVIILTVVIFYCCRRRKQKKGKAADQGSGTVLPLTRIHSYQAVPGTNPDFEDAISPMKPNFSDDPRKSAYSKAATSYEDEKPPSLRKEPLEDPPRSPLAPSHHSRMGSKLSVSSFQPPALPNHSTASVHSAAQEDARSAMAAPSIVVNTSSGSTHERNSSPNRESSRSRPSSPTPSRRRSQRSTHTLPPTSSAPAETSQPEGASGDMSRARAHFMAMEAKRAAMGGSGSADRRFTFNPDAPESNDYEALHSAPIRRFQGSAVDEGRRTTFHEHQEGMGGGRATVYFDADDNIGAAVNPFGEKPSLQNLSPHSAGAPQRPPPLTPPAPSHARTSSIANSLRSHRRQPSGGSIMKSTPSPLKSSFAAAPQTPSSLGPRRQRSNSGGSTRSPGTPSHPPGMGNIPNLPSTPNSAGWRMAAPEEADLSDQRMPYDRQGPEPFGDIGPPPPRINPNQQRVHSMQPPPRIRDPGTRMSSAM